MLNFLIRRRQILLLVCVYISVNSGVAEFESLDDHGGHGGNSECALLLEGPGRSSAYDYNLNTLRLNPSYGGGHTCITYDAVNNAYTQARKYIRVVDRKERYQNEELATVGELLLEVSRILSRTYGLSVDEIEHGLPLIDTSKTLIREACPAFLSNVHCQPGKYRRYDGLCNNLKHPTWGAVQSTFARLLKPVYSDAISDPRVGAHGASLPPPRIVSRTIHPDEGYHDHAATILLISWGQFMDHDLTLTATPLDPVTRNEPEECCHRPHESRNPYCIQIDIPHDDPFYGVYGVRCIDFVRGFPGVRAGCRLGSRNQFNILSGIIDGNTVYGVEENFARSLRTGYGGLLRMNPVFAQYGLHDLLPLKLDIPDEGCTRPNKSMYCFDAGEIRVNEQLVLTCMHTLMAREHNRVTAKLGEINPHWDDETLYQEGRRIVIAEIQHITYNEFLPLVLGKEVMAKFGLLLQKEGFWDGYDANVNPSVIASFSAAAFRFGHSLLPTNVERWSKAHKFIASRRLRDLIRQPYDLYRAGVIDEYFMGMSNQVAQAMDDSVTQEVTNHLFRKPNQPFGVDLAAFNMQRGREFGLPSYMEFRKYCGLPDAHGWDDLFGSMNNITVKRYSQIYVHPGDIDLWSGGVSERPLPGAMVGPTFACIIASQFSNTRRGDRFWYELGGHPHSFSLEQLSEIRKARLARIVCDNTDLIDTIQLYPMVLPDHEINPRVPCRSGVLLHVDLTKWADYGGGQFSHQNPVHADSLSLGAYENDPSVGKYVNQDGLQQLRHYLKVGPYKSFLNGQPKNAFFGYLRQVIKSKRNIDPNDYAAESLRALKIAADARLSNETHNNTSNKRNRKRSRDFVLPAISNKNSYNNNNTIFSPHTHSEGVPQDIPDCPHKPNICSNVSHPLPKPERGDVLGKVKFVNLQHVPKH
ncbi:unnamed protein product [Orchesella dallaii]|uniref:Chorion peroxidase n=1 Tax=Orchesella dallaii TaxID=48710 RepID=A0ABP1S5T7_9HEXA